MAQTEELDIDTQSPSEYRYSGDIRGLQSLVAVAAVSLSA